MEVPAKPRFDLLALNSLADTCYVYVCVYVCLLFDSQFLGGYLELKPLGLEVPVSTLNSLADTCLTREVKPRVG